MNRRKWIVGVSVALGALIMCCGGACIGRDFLFASISRGIVSAVADVPNPRCVPDRPAGITVEDLAGRYRAAGGEEITLNASGTFTVQGFKSSDGQPRTDTGTWWLQPPQRQWTAEDIHLSAKNNQFSVDLAISGTRDKPWLYSYRSDPDLCEIRRFDRA